jgi:tRNA threonylcarbamoyladenosine biosynthesis protein TsaE
VAPGPEDMRRLGAALARVLHPGDTVLLGGDLGAGKTTFTQGLASALGVGEPVTSPTFVLVHSYPTRGGWDLLHADVWRLGQLQEVIDLAIPELLEEGAAVVVEWGELAAPALAADCLHVAIDFGAADAPDAAADAHADRTADVAGTGAAGTGAAGTAAGTGAAGARRLVFTAGGPTWEARMGALADAVAATPATPASPASPG